jgi:hypothetical protein
MKFDLSIIQLFISFLGILGIGGILNWVIRIENRITAMETRCSIVAMRKTDRCDFIGPPRHEERRQENAD